MATISAKAVANHILRYMKEQQYSSGGGYLEVSSEEARRAVTKTIKEGYNVAPEFKMNWTKLRTTLERLYHAGVISRRIGNKKIRYWKLLVHTWNMSDPFEKVEKDKDTIKPPQPAPIVPPAKSPTDVPINDLEQRIATLEKEHKELTAALTYLSVKLTKEVDKAKSMASTSVKKIVVIRPPDTKKVKLTDVTLPGYFDELKDLAECRENILLVGPAGCGKSTVARLLSRVLKLKFGKVGGSGGMNENHLLGWLKQDLTGGEDHYQSTPFLTCYENGGVCLVDELDAMDENVMLALNSALDDTGELPIPKRKDKPLANKHEDFVCVATANTFGRGATRMYSGRNQLDEATVDRFRMGIIEVWYDDAIERAVCPDEDLRAWAQGVRDKIVRSDLRRVMSTRFMAKAYKMMKARDWKLDKIKEKFFLGWTNEEKGKVA